MFQCIDPTTYSEDDVFGNLLFRRTIFIKHGAEVCINGSLHPSGSITITRMCFLGDPDPERMLNSEDYDGKYLW